MESIKDNSTLNFMKFAVVTLCTEDWREFAEVTDANKKEYCARHDYYFRPKCGEPFHTRFHYGNPEKKEMGWEWGFERAFAFRDAFEAHTDCDWVYFSDTDAMITNHTRTLDKIVDNRYHVILAADINGTNCGNLFIRNSEIGRAFVNSMIGAMPAYRDNPMAENQWIQEMATATYWKKYIKITPQRMFNAYDYTLYQFPKFTGTKDILGVDGQWQSGDFALHIVGGMAMDKKTLAERISIAKTYLEKVVK
jgi:hypothetical protein